MVLVIDNYYYVGKFPKTTPKKFITYNVEFILIYNWLKLGPQLFKTT